MAALALLCWQTTLDETRAQGWLIGFSVCLLLAGLLHTYAVLLVVPFGIYELIRTIEHRRINWRRWAAMVIPAFLAALSSLPLFLAFRGAASNTTFLDWYPPSAGAFSGFYGFLVGPCLFFMIAFGAILAIDRVAGRQETGWAKAWKSGRAEAIVCASFILLPLFGLILAKVAHGPFFGRYFMSALLGICVLVGLGAGVSRMRWVPFLLAFLLAVPVGWNYLALLWHRHSGKAEALSEPFTGYTMNVSLAEPLHKYRILEPYAKDPTPIGLCEGLDFMYLTHYSPELRTHLYYIQRSKTDFSYLSFRTFHAFAPFQFQRELTKSEFLKLAPRVLVYAPTGFFSRELADFVQAGATITSLKVQNEHFLAELNVNPNFDSSQLKDTLSDEEQD
jgi:hypothetical protein